MAPRRAPNGCVFIKDARNARMSDVSEDGSGAGDEAGEMETEVDTEAGRPHVVVVSHIGDKQPDEMLSDMMTMFFLNQGTNVTSYVCLADFSLHAAFLAQHKTTFEREYAKKMVPSTFHLKRLDADVAILFCHGVKRNQGKQRPARLDFYGDSSVSVAGDSVQRIEALELWSCSSCTLGTSTLKKPDHGVALSDVVDGCRLVLLLSCYAGYILEEYEAEKDKAKRPDFAFFDKPDTVYDISLHVFLALLTKAIEKGHCRDEPFYVFVKRQMAIVISWVQNFGIDAEVFWEYLESSQCVRMVKHNCDDKDTFRIKGCITEYSLFEKREDKMEDKMEDNREIILRDLQTLTLAIWHEGENGEEGHVMRLGNATPQAVLRRFISPAGVCLRQAGAGPAAVETALLLLQLKDLLRGA